MSSTTPSDSDIYELALDQPLIHPAVTAEHLFEFDYSTPDHLTEIYRGVYKAIDPDFPNAPKNIARFYPREHGKSEGGTVVVPTWAALRDPNVRVLILSETEGQAKGKLEECREHIERLAPRFGHSIEYSNRTELQLEREATYDVPTIKAAGFGTGITGGHFDLLVFDDVVSWESQRTDSRREKRWKQFQDYLNLGSEGESVFLVLGTRKHPEDLYSHLLEGPAWDTRVLKALADWSIVENGEYDVVTDAGARYSADEIHAIDTASETIVTVEPHREVDVLWPERWPLETLLMDMIAGFGAEQSTLVWKRENQNDAQALQGQVLSEDMLVYADELPEQGLQWYAGLDVAAEDDPEAAATGDTDFWALAVLAHAPSEEVSYVTHLARRRGITLKQGIGWVQRQLTQVRQEYDAHPGRALVESNNTQRWFVQQARDEGLSVAPTDSKGAKEDRIIDMSSRFESGRVQLLEGATGDGWESFVQEWVAFPTGDHDDRLDAIEIALRNVGSGDVRQIGSMRDLM